MKYRIVEKRNPLAVHGIFDSEASALRHLRDVVPVYVSRGYYMDKTLTPADFHVVPTSTPSRIPGV